MSNIKKSEYVVLGEAREGMSLRFDSFDGKMTIDSYTSDSEQIKASIKMRTSDYEEAYIYVWIEDGEIRAESIVEDIE